jgi:hypothetical protein
MTFVLAILSRSNISMSATPYVVLYATSDVIAISPPGAAQWFNNGSYALMPMVRATVNRINIRSTAPDAGCIYHEIRLGS